MFYINYSGQCVTAVSSFAPYGATLHVSSITSPCVISSAPKDTEYVASM